MNWIIIRQWIVNPYPYPKIISTGYTIHYMQKYYKIRIRIVDMWINPETLLIIRFCLKI